MSPPALESCGPTIGAGRDDQTHGCQLGLGQRPLEPSVLLAQLRVLLGGVGVHPAVAAAPAVQRRRRHLQLGWRSPRPSYPPRPARPRSAACAPAVIERLVAELEGVFAAAGGPAKVRRMDNGPEMISQALQQFCAARSACPTSRRITAR